MNNATKSALLEHVSRLTERCIFPERGCTENEVDALAAMDIRITNIKNCPQLIELSEENSININDKIEAFFGNLRSLWDREARVIKRALERHIKLTVEEFESTMKRLKWLEKIKSISKDANSASVGALSNIVSFLENQRTNLESISEELFNEPKKIKKYLQTIIRTLNKINDFKELVGEPVKKKIEAVELDIRKKVSSSIHAIVSKYDSEQYRNESETQFESLINNLLNLTSLIPQERDCLNEFQSELEIIKECFEKQKTQVQRVLNEAMSVIKDAEFKKESAVSF